MADPLRLILTCSTTAAARTASDAALLARFADTRDNDAFTELVRRHGPVVYRVCRRLVGSTAADDAFQATFLVLATRISAARAAGSVGGWLVGVAGRLDKRGGRPLAGCATKPGHRTLVPLPRPT